MAQIETIMGIRRRFHPTPFRKVEPSIDTARTPQMIPKDHPIGNSPPKASFNDTIFRPTNTRTTARPYLSR
jgi:hypothetical protein